jgi:hypothetical protein
VTQERRRTPRYAIDLVVEFGHGVGRTLDVSSSALCFATDCDVLAADQDVEIVLSFQHAAPATRVTCNARVIRVECRQSMFRVAVTYEPLAFEAIAVHVSGTSISTLAP